ncbi:MAG: hypothetical protein L0Z53_09710, partial [Acidobacteriales bacterium]|nr:hypothetical protein [Terriglobales bacterium]
MAPWLRHRTKSLPSGPQPPHPPFVDTTCDVLHGEQIADPFRWVEKNSPELERFLCQQEIHTRDVLALSRGRQRLQKRVADLFRRVTLIGSPQVAGESLFFARRT